MKLSNILWGIVLIILGVIIGLNALDITHIDIFFKGWWTFLIIIPCFIEIFRGKDTIGNSIGLIIGVFLFLACRKIISFDLVLKLTLPCVLIVIGIILLFKGIMSNKISKKIDDVLINTDEEYYAIFNNKKTTFTDCNISGSNINAIFGEYICDFSNYKFSEDVVFNVSSIFGSVKIIVPNDVNVITSGVPIFGSINNKTNNKGKKTIYIKSTVMFGGVEVK